MVLDAFRQRGRKPGPYKDVQVSFSHDPCERPLHLVSQMSNGHSNGHPMLSAPHNSNGMPLRNARRLTNHDGRTTKNVDEDGWHTVQRRR